MEFLTTAFLAWCSRWTLAWVSYVERLGRQLERFVSFQPQIACKASCLSFAGACGGVFILIRLNFSCFVKTRRSELFLGKPASGGAGQQSHVRAEWGPYNQSWSHAWLRFWWTRGSWDFCSLGWSLRRFKHFMSFQGRDCCISGNIQKL